MAVSRVARNTAVGTVGRIATMVLGFAVTPTLLASLGTESFGILALVGSLQSYFGVLDFGIGGGLSRFMTYYQERGDERLVRAISSFGLLFYVIVTFVLFPPLMLFARDLVHWLGIRAGLVSVAVNALYIVFGLFIGSSMSGIISARVYAAHRMDLNTISSLLGNVIYVISVITLVPRFPTIFTALGCTVLQVLVSTVANWAFMQRLSPGLLGNPAAIPRTLIRQLFSFGFWIQINSITAIINLEADKLVIGRFLGVASVAPYQVGNRLALLSRALPLQLLGALFPDMTARLARDASDEEIADLYRASLRALMASTLVIVGFLVAVAGPFVLAWLGRPLPGAAAIAIALMISYSVNNLTGVGTTLLRAQGRPKYETIYAVASASLNIGATIALVPHYGLYGVVGGTIIGNVVGSLLFMGVFHKLTHMPLVKTVFSWLLPLMAGITGAAVISGVAVHAAFEHVSGRLAQFAVLGCGGVVYLVVAALLLALFGFYEKRDRDLASRVLSKLPHTRTS